MWNIQSFIHREQNINSLRLESVNSKWMRMSFPKKWHQFSSVQSLSCVWLFASPWTAAPRPPCPSPTPGAYSNSCPWSQWCHPTISFSVVPFFSHLRFYYPLDYSPPGSSVHGIFQARILEWVAISFSRGTSRPRSRTWVSCIAGRFFTDSGTSKAWWH